MTQPINPPPLVNLALRGRIVGMPDIWGNTFPVSTTDIELLTSHWPYISLVSKTANPPKKLSLSTTMTRFGGIFEINVYPYSPLIPYSTLFFEFKNGATGSKYTSRVAFDMFPDYTYRLPGRLGVNREFELNDIQTPWRTETPEIAGWKGRRFKYPADLANVLKADLDAKGEFEIKRTILGLREGFELREAAGLATVSDYAEIDRIFRVLERESKGPKSGVAGKLANEILPLFKINRLKMRSAADALRAMLDHCAGTRINARNAPEFGRRQLGAAVQRAFGGGRPSFSGLQGRAAFCGIVFAAAALESGSTITATSSAAWSEHTTRIVIS